MSRPSLVNQVKRAFQAIFEPGVSRHQLKEMGRADEYVVGIGTVEEYIRIGIRAARWCRAQYGIRLLEEIVPEMMSAYVGSLAGGDPSGGYGSKVVSALRKLDYAPV